jgi:hypothetical protein
MYYYIVGFDVRMHYITLPQKTQCQKELLCICTDSPNVQSDILAKAFDNIADSCYMQKHQYIIWKRWEMAANLSDSKTKQRRP